MERPRSLNWRTAATDAEGSALLRSNPEAGRAVSRDYLGSAPRRGAWRRPGALLDEVPHDAPLTGSAPDGEARVVAVQERRRFGELDDGVEGTVVSVVCSRGVELARATGCLLESKRRRGGGRDV